MEKKKKMFMTGPIFKEKTDRAGKYLIIIVDASVTRKVRRPER